IENVLHVQVRVPVFANELCMPSKVHLRLAEDPASELDPQLHSEQVRAQTADDPQIYVVIERVAVIQHDHGTSSGREHSINLANGAGGVGCVVEHAVGIHKVKGTAREWQVFGISLDKTAFETEQLKTPACDAYRCVC